MADTILSLASGAVPAGVAVIRLSGTEAFSIANRVSSLQVNSQEHASARLVTLHDDETLLPLDKALRLIFRRPHSFTGEDVVEFHVHGGLVLIAEVLELLQRCGARQSRGGEFSERAFLNGKIDLSQAEGVSDLIAATSRESRRLATRQLSGELSNVITEIENQLQTARVLLEASIDFPEDVGDVNVTDLLRHLNAAKGSLNTLMETERRGTLLRSGATVAIVGRPNVGKSSLLNTLVGQNRAIVSSIPGTTRDTIESFIIINGVQIRFIDTAGMRKTQDEIEALGVARSVAAIQQADLLISLFTADIDPVNLPALASEQPKMVVKNKADLYPESTREESILHISTVTGEGISSLLDGISLHLNGGTQVNETSHIAINARHAIYTRRALDAVQRAMDMSNLPGSPELVAVDIHDASLHLACITGRNVIDSMHSEVFAKFCIGK